MTLALLETFSLPFVQRGLLEILLLAIPCGIIGSWIVLRGLAFHSHAVGTATFPGLVLADGRRVTPETSLVVGMNAYRLAQLQAKGGIFENERFEPIWDSKKAFGDDDGVIRALIVRYIREELKGIVPARNDHNWTLTGLDTALAREQGIVRELINRGELTVPSKGTFTNIASINVKGKVTHTPADYAAALAAAEARAASSGNDDARAAAQADIVLIKALKTF